MNWHKLLLIVLFFVSLRAEDTFSATLQFTKIQIPENIDIEYEYWSCGVRVKHSPVKYASELATGFELRYQYENKVLSAYNRNRQCVFSVKLDRARVLHPPAILNVGYYVLATDDTQSPSLIGSRKLFNINSSYVCIHISSRFSRVLQDLYNVMGSVQDREYVVRPKAGVDFFDWCCQLRQNAKVVLAFDEEYLGAITVGVSCKGDFDEAILKLKTSLIQGVEKYPEVIVEYTPVKDANTGQRLKNEQSIGSILGQSLKYINR